MDASSENLFEEVMAIGEFKSKSNKSEKSKVRLQS